MKRIALLLVLVAGCTTTKPYAPPLPLPQAQPEPVVEVEPEPLPPSPLELLSPEIARATEDFLRTGKAPTLDHSKDGFIIYPFGVGRPTVSCRAFAFCRISLEPGERVSDEGGIGLADAVRWQIQRVYEGEGATRRVHLLVKPNDDLTGLKSDLTIGTSKRLYDIRVSYGAARTVGLQFYYPLETHAALKAYYAQSPQKKIRRLEVNTERINKSYAWDCARGLRLCPREIFDDGTKTVILLPDGLETIGIPALWIERSGEKQIANVNTSFLPQLVMDGLFDRAELRSGGTDTAQIVTITRN